MQTDLNRLTLDEAMAIQDAVADRLSTASGGIGGFKIAWNTDAQMQQMDMPHPGMGRVFRNDIHLNGATLNLRKYATLCIEAEIIAHLGTDVKPGLTYTPENMGEFVEAYSVGIEVLNRYDGCETASASSSIAHNIYNAGVVLGEIRLPADELDHTNLTTRVARNNEILSEGLDCAPQPPLEAVAFLANHFTQRDITLPKGSVILCGSHIPLLKVREAGEYTVFMSGLGQVFFNAEVGSLSDI